MLKPLLRILACLALLLVAAQASLAAEPSKFSLLTTKPGALPEAGLNDDVRVRIDGDTAIQPGKVQLRLDGTLLGVEPRVRPDGRELIFRLARTDANRAMWARLLGNPFAHDRKFDVPIGIEIDGKPLAWSTSKDDEAPDSKIKLITYDVGLMWLGCIVSAVVVIIVFVGCLTTPMMRDGGIPQVGWRQRPYSLGRFQMVTWFCLILISFLFIFTVTLDINSITAESFILMGISGATALASVAIDQGKNGPPAQVQKNLNAMGIKTLADVDKLGKGAKDTPNDKAKTVLPGANIPAASASGQPANNDPTFKELQDEYRAQIKDLKSAGLLADLVEDASGPTIHRWQILIWTVILGAIYVGRVYMNLETPTFGTNLLALMGISGGVYLGFKIPEKQTS
jgi:hypothetical protein